MYGFTESLNVGVASGLVSLEGFCRWGLTAV